MRCNEYEVLISAYADGELDGPQKSDVEAHIQHCAACRELYRETVRLQRDMTDALTHSQHVPDLVSAVTAQIQQRPRFGFTWRWAAAAAAALVAVGGYALWQSPQSNEPARKAVVLPPPKVVKQQQKVPVVQQEQQQVIVESKPTTPALQPRPRVLTKKPEKPAVKPEVKKEQIAEDTAPAPNIAVAAAEVEIEYTEGTNAAGYARDLLAAPLSPVIGAGPEKKVLTETEVIAEDGTRTRQLCYRIVNSGPEDAPEEPDQGE